MDIQQHLCRLKKQAHELDLQIKAIEEVILANIPVNPPKFTSASFKPVCDCCGEILEGLRIVNEFTEIGNIKIKNTNIRNSNNTEGRCPSCHKLINQLIFNKDEYL